MRGAPALMPAMSLLPSLLSLMKLHEKKVKYLSALAIKDLPL